MALTYAFIDSNDHFEDCVQKAGRENIRIFLTFDAAKVGKKVSGDMDVWQEICHAKTVACDYFVYFGEDYEMVLHPLCDLGINHERVVSYEFFLGHINLGIYHSRLSEQKIVEVFHQLAVASVLDWDLYFSQGSRLSSSNEYLGSLSDVKVAGRRSDDGMFPLQRRLYSEFVDQADLVGADYDIIFFSRYRTAVEYEQCLRETESVSRYILILLRDEEKSLAALPDLSDWGCYLAIPCNSGVLLLLDKKRQHWLTMYVVTHKSFLLPECDDIYVPIQAGSGIHPSLGYLRDDAGDNISAMNPFLNEITALYWIWKHDNSPYVGLVHYRRYFLDCDEQSKLLQEDTALRLLKVYDILVVDAWDMLGPVNLQLKVDLGLELFERANRAFEAALAKYQPDYCEAYRYVMSGHSFYRCNMFVTRHELCDKYCEWLFSFALEAMQHIDVAGLKPYFQRTAGFFCERLFTVWLLKQNLKVKEMHVVELK